LLRWSDTASPELVSEAIAIRTVNPFFVSEDRLARQAYRYDYRYRLAAFLLIATILLQVPFIAFICYQRQIEQREGIRRGFAFQKKAQITADLDSLKETEVQLRQIKSWEPILRGRMPVSAVLGAIEQTIPREVALSRISLEATNYRQVSIYSGSFRVPETYTITLQGEQNVPDQGVWQKFINGLLSRLPPGSKLLTSLVDNDPNLKSAVVNCKAVLIAQSNGNYFPLGVNKIDTEEDL
jgi:hypothetical protein